MGIFSKNADETINELFELISSGKIEVAINKLESINIANSSINNQLNKIKIDLQVFAGEIERTRIALKEKKILQAKEHLLESKKRLKNLKKCSKEL